KYREDAHMTPSNRCKFDFPHDASMHPDHWVGDRAAEHIKNLDPSQKAFVWVSFSGPHYPVDTPREYTDMVDMSKDGGRVFRKGEWEKGDKYHANGYYGPGTTEGSSHADKNSQMNYSEEYWTDWRRRYFGNVVLIDEMMGKVIKAAQEKWGDDFIVIYTSDHGEMMGNHSLWGKNGSLYEDVLRVPLAVWEPHGKHECVKKTVLSTDLYPTILKYAGITGLHPLCDGVPLDEDEGRSYVISECDNRVAVIKDRIKLEWNRYPRTGRIYKELYDLEKDPDEFENEYFNPEYSAKVRDLEAILEEKEEKEHLLSTVFFDNGERPYYANFGNGAGYISNGGLN
ncbi:MAG: sulfatase-like hydrolase/transferase, partial [Bullifex sp.]